MRWGKIKKLITCAAAVTLLGRTAQLSPTQKSRYNYSSGVWHQTGTMDIRFFFFFISLLNVEPVVCGFLLLLFFSLDGNNKRSVRIRFTVSTDCGVGPAAQPVSKNPTRYQDKMAAPQVPTYPCCRRKKKERKKKPSLWRNSCPYPFCLFKSSTYVIHLLLLLLLLLLFFFFLSFHSVLRLRSGSRSRSSSTQESRRGSGNSSSQSIFE